MRKILITLLVLLVISISFCACHYIRNEDVQDEPFTVLETQDSSNSQLSKEKAKQIAKLAIENSEYNGIEYDEINTYFRSNNTWAVEFLENHEEEVLDGGLTVIIDDKTGEVVDIWLGSAKLHQ